MGESDPLKIRSEKWPYPNKSSNKYLSSVSPDSIKSIRFE